jgi:uncharacterized protein YjiS (DUF1127 family)
MQKPRPSIFPSALTREEDRTMTQSLNSYANRDTGYADPIAGDRSVADALRNLAYAAIRPLGYRRHYQRILGDLARLDDVVLRDIGLEPWDIETHAHRRAALRWPLRASLWAGLSDVATALWRAAKRERERRKAKRDLMMLDDRGLKDIGLSRSQIPWIIDAMVRRLDDVAAARGPVPGDDEWADIHGKAPLTPASIGAVTAPRLEAPANDDRAREAS